MDFFSFRESEMPNDKLRSAYLDQNGRTYYRRIDLILVTATFSSRFILICF